MAIRFKADTLARLREAGYSTYRIRKDKIFGQGTLHKIRNGEVVSPAVIDTMCRLLNCQPGEIMEYVAEQ